MYEYHKEKFVEVVCRWRRTPTKEDAETYYLHYLSEKGKEDERTLEQRLPL
jgi:hypothetical protein